MAFVNEYVSEEDIKKYKLDDIWLKYHPEEKSVPSHYRHEWTIDHARDLYLKWVKVQSSQLKPTSSRNARRPW